MVKPDPGSRSDISKRGQGHRRSGQLRGKQALLRQPGSTHNTAPKQQAAKCTPIHEPIAYLARATSITVTLMRGNTYSKFSPRVLTAFAAGEIASGLTSSFPAYKLDAVSSSA